MVPQSRVSLTTVLVGILCLQWLREFQRDSNLPHKDAVALRQMRYEGLIKWHVPGILSTLPVLLQLSLVLFFIGLLDLLWSLNTLVAECVSAVVGMAMLFLIATTALPTLQKALTRNKHLSVPQCPYKSPQSWLFYRVGRWFYFPSRCCVFLTQFTGLRTLQFIGPRPLLETIHQRAIDPLFGDFDDNSWVAYDMRWRRFRDAEDLTWGKPTTIWDSDDVVHGLHWINKTFAHSIEAIYLVYHSLAELDIPTAAATITEIYLKRGLLDYAMFSVFHYGTFKAMMDDPSSPNEMQKRDIIAAYYLKLHQDRHPVLKTVYVETVIRILNTRGVLEPFDDWLSEILRDLASKPLLAPSVTTGAAAQLSTNKIIIQTLLFVKSLITRDMLYTKDVVMTWALLRQLLTLPSPPPPNLRQPTQPIDSEPPNRGLGLNLDHIKLAGEFFEAFQVWLPQRTIYGWERSAKMCTEGMIRLFSSSIDIAALDAEYPVQMAKAAGLVRALDDHMSRLGGAVAVLDGTRCWFDLPGQKICEVGEWDSLVSRLKGIEGGDR